MKVLPLSLLLLSLAGQRSVRAAAPGDEVVVVYNARVPESKALAEFYAQKRQVPPQQIFGFDLPTTDEISRQEFRDALQEPLAKALEQKKLWQTAAQTTRSTNNRPVRVDWKVVESKIRYAVLCYGVPFHILEDPTWKEEGLESLRPEMRRNEAAVDSELALLPLLDQKLPLAGPVRSLVYGATNVAWLHPTNGVLLVARLDGPSAAIARGLVDKALQGEADGLWGRAYFDLRNTTEPGYKAGDDWIRSAAEICRHLGFETVVDENPGTFPVSFPMSQIGLYIGWYDQNVSGPFTLPAVEFMPGAFAYHLHSYSAHKLRSANESWVGPLLAKGVTATMGCVAEPYLTGTPEIAVFVSRFIFNGMSFGEAAYACQPVLSWQTTVVGDPLYRPFIQGPEQMHEGLTQRHSKLLEWSYLRLLNLNLANGKPLADCATLLERVETTKESAVLSEKLGDLYTAEGKPSSAAHAYALALNLGPSPQQRVRLLLTLAEKLAALDRQQESYDAYQKLVTDFPQYPDKLKVLQKLLPLAHKLSHQADAEKYEAEISRLTAPPQAQAKR